MQTRAQVVTLISGRGSNLSALLRQQEAYEIIAVISDKSEAYGLEAAKLAGVGLVEGYGRAGYSSKSEQKAAIYSKIRSLNPDLICLAGFMQVIEASFVEEFYGRLINIHPSLLPELSGLNTHQRALENRLKIHGCTVHFVDSGLDTGPIIAQASCPVLESDTEESLATRVLELEHRLYPWVLGALAGKEILIEVDKGSVGGKVRFSKVAIEEAGRFGFVLGSTYGH